MEFNAIGYSVDRIISLLRAGRLALPEFQRDFVWGPSKVVELLDSVSKGWPVGSLLLLKGPQPFGAKGVDSGPPLRGQVDLFVLDGQQRITSLYHALADASEICYFIDFNRLVSGADDYIRWRKRSSFSSSFPDMESRAKEGLALVREVSDDELFFQWQSFFSRVGSKSALFYRENYLSGLKAKSYRLPVIELESEIELEALARIFETINRTGVKLNAFDLMVAVLYPQGFNLREAWEEALLEFTTLRDFEIDGVEILKLIALWTRRDQQISGERITVRGVRQGDVLAVPPQEVKRNWRRALVSFNRALQTLRNFGVSHPCISPPGAMILALAAFNDPNGVTSLKKQDVSIWFWSAIRDQSYSQGANTRVIADVDQAGAPLQLAFTETESRLAFLEPIRRNRILLNGMAAALVRHGAKDLLTGESLGAGGGSIAARSISALKSGNARPDDSGLVASMVFSHEHSFSKIASEVRSGKRLIDVCAPESLQSQIIGANELEERYDERASRVAALLRGADA